MLTVSVKTTKGLERSMEVQVPAARIDEAVNARLQNLARTAKLQGFRPGKVPPNVIRQMYGKQVQQEATEEVIRRSFAEAVIDRKLNPAGSPRIEPVQAIAGQDLKYTATFEVYPEVEVKGLDSLEIERPVVSVTAADVDTMVEHLRKQRPNWTPVTRASQEGDRVTVDFEGRLDGVPFEGGQGAGVPIVIGEGRMLPDLENGLKGLRAGEEKTVKVSFPEQYPTRPGGPALAGKTTEFSIKVNSVDAPELPPVDDAFCQSYGIPEGGEAELRRQIEQNMLREVEQGTRSALRGQILDKLVSANSSIELPAALVDQAVSDMQVDWGRRNNVFDVARIPGRENFEQLARRRVTLSLLISEVVRKEGLKADPAKVEDRLQAVVVQEHNSHQHHHASASEHHEHLAEMMQAYRRDRQAMSQIESMVLEDAAMEWLIAKAKVVDKPQTFEQFTHFSG